MKNILWNVLLWICGFCVGVVFMIYRCGYILEGMQKKADRHYSNFILLDRLLIHIEQGHGFTRFFHENDIGSIAIYGMGKVGKHLKAALEKEGLTVRYVIDEGESALYGKEAHYNLQDRLPSVDMVIVTPITEFQEIKRKIARNNGSLRIIPLDKLFDEDIY